MNRNMNRMKRYRRSAISMAALIAVTFLLSGCATEPGGAGIPGKVLVEAKLVRKVDGSVKREVQEAEVVGHARRIVPARYRLDHEKPEPPNEVILPYAHLPRRR